MFLMLFKISTQNLRLIPCDIDRMQRNFKLSQAAPTHWCHYEHFIGDLVSSNKYAQWNARNVRTKNFWLFLLLYLDTHTHTGIHTKRIKCQMVRQSTYLKQWLVRFHFWHQPKVYLLHGTFWIRAYANCVSLRARLFVSFCLCLSHSLSRARCRLFLCMSSNPIYKFTLA